MFETAKLVVVACARVVLPVTPKVPPTTALPEASIVVDALAPNAPVLPVTRPAYVLVDVANVVVELLAVNPPLKASCVDVAFEGKRYENDADVMHVPFTERQPEVMLRPLAKVEVAVPVCAKFNTERPPEKVDVPVFDTDSSPCTRALPVVVAPPLMVSPVACAPAPAVEEP